MRDPNYHGIAFFRAIGWALELQNLDIRAIMQQVIRTINPYLSGCNASTACSARDVRSGAFSPNLVSIEMPTTVLATVFVDDKLPV